MNLKELIIKLEKIKRLGYIESNRIGSTGIGFTFESLIGIAANNMPIPDIGGKVEIKTTRRDATSLVTLFTFNKGAWVIKQKDFVDAYGYLDDKNRKALKSTLFVNKKNSLGLILSLDEKKNLVNISNNKNEIVASWDLYVVVGKFYTKLSRLLLVIADRKIIDGKEYFNYNEAYILSEPQTRNFLEGFNNGVIGIDIRMHLNPTGSVRNRGTGFRMKEIDMVSLYSTKKKIL